MANVSLSNGQKANVPKLRFPGFEGEWEKTAFNSLFSILKNNTLSRAELTDSGTVKNIHYGDILVKFDDFIKADNPMIPYVKDTVTLKYEMDYLQSGDIVIADTAEDDTVGKATEIINPTNIPVVSGLHTIPCRPNKIFASSYLGYYINSSAYHKQLYPFMQGIKVTSISKGNIRKTTISYPSNNEQHKIANFLILVSVRIEKQHQLIETLKKYKRGLLSCFFSTKNAKYFCNAKCYIFSDLACRRNEKYDPHSGGEGICIELEHIEQETGRITGSTPAKKQNSIKNVCKSGDVLFGKLRPYLRKYAFIKQECVCSSEIWVLIPSPPILPQFLFYLIQSDDFIKVANMSSGTKMPRAEWSNVEKSIFFIPSNNNQQIIISQFERIDALITNSDMIYRQLQKLKEGLLQQLFI